MHSSADVLHVQRATAWLVGTMALATLAVATFAAAVPRVENPHGAFKEDCQLCHTAKSWKTVRVSPKFDHSKYGFPLSGAHATSDCMSCHTTLEFSQSKTACASCHQDPHRGEMGTECARCHGARSFVDRGPMVRAHAQTRFPLTGSHAAADCAACHRPAAQGQMQYKGTSTECRSCHLPQYQATRNPDHAAGGFPTDCQTCHTPTVWTTASFNHDVTAFPLTGAHRAAHCNQCHTTTNFKDARAECASCHQPDYDRAQPPHAAAGFGATACASCHNTTSFAGASFNHANTSFPLTGAHVGATCTSCHGDGVYDGKSTACYSCHTSDYTGASPTHTAAAFPTAACASCHGTSSWSTTFNHSATSFPLTGAHVSATCTNCHGDGVYDGKSTACYSCHTGDYTGASPRHTPAAFPTAQCANCHTTSTWSGGAFNHSATLFPLTGAHVSATCTNCHGDGVYAGKSMACYSCHTTDYSGASPPHSPASFPTAACANCHNTTTFANATFDHNLTTFPLTGAHRSATCTNCHGDGVYAGKSTDCYSCHTADYASATPPHDPVNYPRTGCACHNTTTWSGATSFNHTTVGFPLTGMHATPPRGCVDCHSTGYVATSRECFSCHASDYSTAIPRHDATNFPTSTTNCTTCHTTANTGHITWTGGRFANHTWFPISSGRHSGIGCMECHNVATNLTSYSCARSCHTNDLADHPNRNGFSLSTVETQCYVCHPRGNGG